MKKIRLNIVIPLSRIENFRRVIESIYNDEYVNKWFDIAKKYGTGGVEYMVQIRVICVLDRLINYHRFEAQPFSDLCQVLYCSKENIAGHAARNIALNGIFKYDYHLHDSIYREYFYSLDDDNILHPDLLTRFNEWHRGNLNPPLFFAFSQLNKDGSTRLIANPGCITVGHIDTAMFIFDAEYAHSNKIYFDETDYCADGKFAEQYVDSLFKSDIFVTQDRLCYYNYLK